MWGKINRFVHSYTVLFAVLFGAFFTSALLIIAILIIGAPQDGMPPSTGDLAVFTMIQMVLAGIIIWLMRKMKVFSADDFKHKNLGKGFLLGWIGIALPLAVFVLGFVQLPPSSLIQPNIPRLVVVILHPFIGTGLFEEVLFRGLILKLLLIKMGYTKKGIVAASVISSVIFALVHSVNAIVGTLEIATTIGQIVSATAMGLFYAALYLRTKNLWVPILLHGFTNLFAGQIFSAIVSQEVMLELLQNQVAADMGGLIANTLLATVPALIAGIFLFRKVKPAEIADDA